MAEFDNVRALIHMKATPCLFAKALPDPYMITTDESQQAIKTTITNARVKVTRISTRD